MAIRELPDTARFHQIVLAAPDIDAGIFKTSIAPALAKASGRVTLYASSNDWALRVSRSFNGYPRAGDASEGIVVVRPIDTIDVTAACNGHSYIGRNGRVLHDLEVLLTTTESARDRALDVGLRHVRDVGYWVLERLR
jgi:esterase/lipase superfamily enzyme